MYNKLKTNYEKGGLDTVVQARNKKYCIFSVVTSNGDIRGSGWFDSIEKCKDYIGIICSDASLDKENIEKCSKNENWKIIKTIARESHYKVGDKVRIRKTGKIETIKCVFQDGGYRGEGGYIYGSTEIEPYFEQEEMVNIDGKEFSKSTIKEALKEYTK